MANKGKQIKVKLNGARYESKTVPASEKVKFNDRFLWTIKEQDKLPRDASVELRFADSAIVDGATLSDGGKRSIQSTIFNVPLKTYTYKIWYKSPTEEYMMEDPELVMEN